MVVVGYLMQAGRIENLKKLDQPLSFYQKRAQGAGFNLTVFANGFTVVLRQSVSIFREVSEDEFTELQESYQSNKPGLN